MLTWHNGAIPEDEIWIKIGGDHGKQSLKFTMEIANTQKPNSQSNTIVIGLAEVKDTYENVKTFLDAGLLNDIHLLKSHVWRDKRIKLFLNGDYLFVACVYGLSGAKGKYPCLWCTVQKEDIQKRTTLFPPRNLNTLRTHHSEFMSKGHGDKDNAKKHFKCIRPPLFDIEPCNVVPPDLHILLGITNKHQKLFEIEVNKIDNLILEQEEEFLTKNGRLVKQYGNLLAKSESHKKTLKSLLQTSNDPHLSDEEKRKYDQRIIDTQNELIKLRDGGSGGPFELKNSEKKDPLSRLIDSTLEKKRIKKQAYHGGTFTGNHCHRYLKANVYQVLTSELVRVAPMFTKDMRILSKVQRLKTQFDTLNNLYRQVHLALSHTRPVDDRQEVIDIQNKIIDPYMHQYREMFPNKTLPKHHILEHHCGYFMRINRFGLSALGEQVGSYAYINSYFKRERFFIP